MDKFLSTKRGFFGKIFFLVLIFIFSLTSFTAQSYTMGPHDPLPPKTKVKLLYVKGKMVKWKCIYSDGTEQIFAVNQAPPYYVLKLIAEAERPPRVRDDEIFYPIGPHPKYTGYMPPEFDYYQGRNVTPQATNRNSNSAPSTQATSETIKAEEGQNKSKDDMLPMNYTVTITEEGKKYHVSDCHTIKKVLKTVTKEQAIKEGYAPCGVCLK